MEAAYPTYRGEPRTDWTDAYEADALRRMDAEPVEADWQAEQDAREDAARHASGYGPANYDLL